MESGECDKVWVCRTYARRCEPHIPVHQDSTVARCRQMAIWRGLATEYLCPFCLRCRLRIVVLRFSPTKRQLFLTFWYLMTIPPNYSSVAWCSLKDDLLSSMSHARYALWGQLHSISKTRHLQLIMLPALLVTCMYAYNALSDLEWQYFVRSVVLFAGESWHMLRRFSSAFSLPYKNQK